MTRRGQSFGRRPAAREVFDLVRIFCEGAKTEPAYLRGLIADLGLPGSVRVVGDCPPTPEKVVDAALDWLERQFEEEGEARPIALFCVFDRDGHHHFEAACARLVDAARRHAKRQVTIRAIPSFPCFEIWFLFHHRRTRKAIVASGGKSAGDCAVAELRRIDGFAGYAKGDGSWYARTRDRLATATDNARYARKDAEDTGEPNPSTDIDLLVDHLRGMAAKIERQKAASRARPHRGE
ncbi:MAG: RloB domain-containing protein [Alphaproteobacteria bacterium]|nr:RloB domain-containing protein [Alphaproteobacteria bacterium]MBF0391997.1 RloB domain-containing protein [Alphaproteobacteria bacterium]